MEGYYGEIRLFAGNFAPQHWAFCDGRILNISEYQALFSILGNTYGGDGRKTFALPDLRNRFPLGASPEKELASKGGAEKVTLIADNLPAHQHEVNAKLTARIKTSNNDFAPNGDNSFVNATANTFGTLADGPEMAEGSVKIGGKIETEVVGKNTPVRTISPYLTMNYIICIFGSFPIRG